MDPQPNRIHEFGPYRLNATNRLLTRGGEAISLPPKTLDLLLLLVENGGRALPKNELLEKLWPGSFVEEASLTFQISTLRKTLGEPVAAWIETVPKYGYRFSPPAPAGAEGTPVDDVIPKRPRRIRIAAALLLVLAPVVWWRVNRSRPETPLALTRLPFDDGLTTEPDLFPGGNLVAYASDRSGEGNLDIWIQQIGGGAPIRLTFDPADEHEPAFSPDGTRVAFRSERDGGGIYVISTLGGEPHKIADQGRRPRFSPDGQWIAYWTGYRIMDPTRAGATKAYMVPSTGGTPQQIVPGFASASYPLWSPDGRKILILGRSTTKIETTDWWVIPASGGTAVRTGARPLAGSSNFFPTGLPGVWIGDEVLFPNPSGSHGLAAIQISPVTLQAAKKLRRLSSSTEPNLYPSVAPGTSGSRIAFASQATNVDIWALPLDANSGRITGALERLTNSPATDMYPAITPDGRRLVFTSDRTGTTDIWLRDMRTGKISRLTSSARPRSSLRISATGDMVVYLENGQSALYFLPVDPQGVPGIEKRVPALGELWDINSDGTKALVGLRGFQSVDGGSGRTSDWFKQSPTTIFEARFSPDDRWITFFQELAPNRSRILVAPFRDASETSPKDWDCHNGWRQLRHSSSMVARWQPSIFPVRS